MEVILRKLRQVHQSVIYHGKHIDQFDAVSLASLDLKKSLPEQLYSLQFKSLQRLVKELTDILNEGSIMEQTQVLSLRMSLDESSKKLGKLKEKTSVTVMDEELLLSSSEGNESPMIPGISKRPRSVSQNLQDALILKDLQSSIKSLYEEISDMLEQKVVSLRLVRQVLEFYHQSIVELAAANGVLKAAAKANLVIPPRVESVFQHKFFFTHEEEELREQTSVLWSSTVLGNAQHVSLAERDLSEIIHHRKKSTFPRLFFGKLGAITILLLWSASECYNNEYLGQKIWNDPTFAIFMCFGDLLLLLLMWGVSMHVWENAGIDYLRLLDLHHTDLGNTKHPVALVLQSFADTALIFLLVFIVFNKAMRAANAGYFHLGLVHTLPVLLAVFFLFRLLLPWQSRQHWLFLLWKVLLAPWYSVDFCAGYIGDLLTSLVRVSVPFVFSLLYVVRGLLAWSTNHLSWIESASDRWWTQTLLFTTYLVPFLTLYPLCIRLMQCLRRSVETGQRWPHFGNALKYTSAIYVVALGTFQPQQRSSWFWITCFIGATIFQFLWDVFQDWGMLEFRRQVDVMAVAVDDERFAGKRAGQSSRLLGDCRLVLRRKRLLGPPSVYLLTMLFNLVLRFAWTLTLLPAIEPKPGVTPSLYESFLRHVGPTVAAAEILRRMVWGFFRLEFEQVSLVERQNAAENEIGEDSEDDRHHIGSTSGNEAGADDDEEDESDLEQPVGDEDSDQTGLLLTATKAAKASIRVSRPTAIAVDEDWTSFMPRDWLDYIFHASPSVCLGTETWTSRLRLIESLVFASLVLLVVVSIAKEHTLS